MDSERSSGAEPIDDNSFKHVQLKAGTEQKLYRDVAAHPRSPNLNISSHFESSPPQTVVSVHPRKYEEGRIVESRKFLNLPGSNEKDGVNYTFSRQKKPRERDVYFDKKLLTAPKLDLLRDAPEKNCSFLVPANLVSSNESPLFLLATIIEKTFEDSPCEFDVKESKCKWKGVCHGFSSFVAFTLRIYSVTMKKCGSPRHIVVVKRLSGESIPFRQLYGSLKAAICSVPCSITSFRMRGSSSMYDPSWTDGGSIEKEIDTLFEMVQSNYIDQQIFALKALSKVIQSNEVARQMVVGNSQFMKNLLNIFEFTDDRYCQSGEHCHLISELQHHTTAVLRKLSEDPSCISSLVQNRFLLKCFESLYLIAKYEIECNKCPDESLKYRHNIKFWYRQSQREIAKCLGNITSCPTVDAVQALLEDGVENSKLNDWCELKNKFSCERLREDAKRFDPVC